MRYLTDAADRSYKVLDDIHVETIAEALRARALGMKVRTPRIEAREPDKGHVVNWILARYFAMPEADRQRFLREGKEEVERHLAEDRIVHFGGSWPFAAPSGEGPGVASIQDEPLPGTALPTLHGVDELLERKGLDREHPAPEPRRRPRPK